MSIGGLSFQRLPDRSLPYSGTDLESITVEDAASIDDIARHLAGQK